MKRKYIEGYKWDWVSSYSSQVTYIEDNYSGYLSFVEVHEVFEKIKVDYANSEKILFDSGYFCLVFLPDNQNWCASAVYNSEGEIIEWYFDITSHNSIDSEGRPYFDDLYLDVVVSPNFEITLLDEHELEAAYKNAEITASEYQLAYKTRTQILNDVVTDKTFLVGFFNQYVTTMNTQGA